MTRPILIFCILMVLTLIDHSFERPLTPDLASLPEMGKGCVADLTVGWLDCFTVFDNGTWIKTRSY